MKLIFFTAAVLLLTLFPPLLPSRETEVNTGRHVSPAPPYTVEELAAAAVQNNRDLRQLAVEEEMTSVDLRSAKAARFPTVDGQIRLSHIANPIDPISVTAGQFGSYPIAGQEDVLLPPEDIRIYEGMEAAMYEFIVSVEQPVFTWGKIRNSISLYRQVLATRRLSIEKKRQELQTTLRIYVYSLYFIREMEELLAWQRELADRLVYISEQAYDNGFILYSDLLEARIQAQKINLADNQLRQQKEQVLLDIKHTTLLQDISYAAIDFSDIDINENDYILPDKEALLGRAYTANTDLKLLGALKNVADYKLDIAEGKSYLKPDIGLRFELSYGGPRFPFIEPDWYGQDDYNLISTLAFTATFFDGGKLKSEIMMKETEVKASHYSLEQGKQQIEKFISETLLNLDLHRSNIEYYRLKIDNAREQAAMEKTRYDAGSGQEADYLQAVIEEYSDRVTLQQEKIQFFTSYFTLLNVVYGE
jgi:outer membrane protein TolC